MLRLFGPFGAVLRPAGRWRGLQACNAYAGESVENQIKAKTEPDCFLIRFLWWMGVATRPFADLTAPLAPGRIRGTGSEVSSPLGARESTGLPRVLNNRFFCNNCGMSPARKKRQRRKLLRKCRKTLSMEEKTPTMPCVMYLKYLKITGYGFDSQGKFAYASCVEVELCNSLEKEEKKLVKGKRYLFLCGEENLTDDKREELDKILQINQPLQEAYLLEEKLRLVFQFSSFKRCASAFGE